MSVEEHFLKVGALDWFYRESLPVNNSDQPPVLLLHGLVSQSYSYREIMPVLAEQGFRAIAPDWSGFGFSAKPGKRDFAYTPDAFVTALAAFIDALECDRLSLVVQGFVGSAGLQYALRHPEKIARLAVLNTPLSTEAQLPWKIKQLGLPLLGEVFTQDPLLVDRTLEGGGPYQVADKDLDVYRRPFLQSSAAGRALLITVRNLRLQQVTAEIEKGFSQWPQPTLIVWGTSDPWLPLSQAQSFASSLANAEVVPLEQVGHYAQEDWHEKVSEVLLPFLRRQET
ncbi:MAG: alpha/beta fold hydrolase [Hormoscilla sp. SP5CHS1]|nr:alpha/beta fold hydrolase [Hormoscilla sp. SP12CHS1]MBC6455501.1 alpha/beta fold hydrolase [Hormoscilla sp. SP5CHS1]